MRIEILMSKLFGYSSQTYFNWKKESDKRPIINLLEKYFTKEELEEFLDSSRIARLEIYPNLDIIVNEIRNKIRKVLQNFGDFNLDDLENFVYHLKFDAVDEFLSNNKNKDVEMTTNDYLVKSRELSNQGFFTQTQILERIEKFEKIDTKTKIAYISSLGSLSYAQFKIWIQYGV